MGQVQFYRHADALLADEAQRMGLKYAGSRKLLRLIFSGSKPTLTIKDQSGLNDQLTADFILDASGFGRVLPRLLDLEKPSGFPMRQALFTHLEDRIDDASYDRNKIRIIVHPELTDVWYWLIPFSNGRCSIGVVGEFLDPVFSPGVTIAMKSASLAADVLDRQFNGLPAIMAVRYCIVCRPETAQVWLGPMSIRTASRFIKEVFNANFSTRHSH
jgi:flavin-dependent dehydrogenase